MNRVDWLKNLKTPDKRDSMGRFVKGFISPNKVGENRICLVCKNKFWAVGSKIDEGKGKYCSNKCYYLSQKGVHLSPETEFKKGQYYSNKRAKFKGNKSEYICLHAWVVRKLGRPCKCEHCGTENAKKFEWANKSGKYKKELSDWVRL